MPAIPSGSAPVRNSTPRSATFTQFVDFEITGVVTADSKAPNWAKEVDRYGNYANGIEMKGTLGSREVRVTACIKCPIDLNSDAEEPAIHPDWASDLADKPEEYQTRVNTMFYQLSAFLTTAGVDVNKFKLTDLIGKHITAAYGSDFYGILSSAGLLKKGMAVEKLREVNNKYKSYPNLLVVMWDDKNNLINNVSQFDKKKFYMTEKGWPKPGSATFDVLRAYIPHDKLPTIEGKFPIDTRPQPGYTSWNDQKSGINCTVGKPATPAASDTDDAGDGW